MIRIVPLLIPELTTYYVITWNLLSTRHASCGTPLEDKGDYRHSNRVLSHILVSIMRSDTCPRTNDCSELREAQRENDT
jgi:hypothetical protein